MLLFENKVFRLEEKKGVSFGISFWYQNRHKNLNVKSCFWTWAELVEKI